MVHRLVLEYCGTWFWHVYFDFFFQAEDGIRDTSVTGVQTCALPISASPAPSSPINSATVPPSPVEKVRLFRSLFRGREEVFPTRFVSKKTGKSGYAPACTNKFVPEVCELPRIKCGECPNQAFLPFNDQAILDHLQGRHVMGVYPLLSDETCWFLAVDFDKAAWHEDVVSFAETCRSVGVPVAVE